MRRTITFAEGIEDGIREKQIEMMRKQKRDVPFTEAVNWVIFYGLYWSARQSGIPQEELYDRVEKWTEGLDKIGLDAFLDGIPVTQEQPSDGLKIGKTPQIGDNAVEIELYKSARTYTLIPIPKDKRYFFPGFMESFELETDIGILKAHVAGGPLGTQVGNPDAGNQIRAGLGLWYRKHPEAKGGTKLRIEALEPGKRYKLSVASKGV